MENKGLCSSCVHDADCSFPRKFPVLQCEEFESSEPKLEGVKKTRQKKMKSK